MQEKKLRYILILLTIFINSTLCFCSYAAEEKKVISYTDLVSRLYNMESLAENPDKDEKCALFSSYDRNSYYDDNRGIYVNWYDNKDGFNGEGWIRRKGKDKVLAEMKGPGCIWRIWSAKPSSGHVRIYIDGSFWPVIDMPFTDFFNRTKDPFTFPSLVYESAKGFNSYIPIPYKKSCKVVADEDYGEFYQITYTTFPEDTVIPSFRKKLSPDYLAALADTDKILKDISSYKIPKDRIIETIDQKLSVDTKNSTATIEIEGPAAISSLKIRVNNLPFAPGDRKMLREISIAIKWDDEEDYSVWAPLGDFFGTAPGANTYTSLPMGYSPTGWFYSNWFMPFEKKAKLSIIYHGKEKADISIKAEIASLQKPIEEYLRFHCKWHRDMYIFEDVFSKADWPLLLTYGSGKFCGMMLHVWNSSHKWWGEGDEKFFIDYEKFPSFFGTGSEDYFGYGWGSPELFSKPYHSQSLCENDNMGHISLNRWHISDAVPFTKSFEGYIEKYFGNIPEKKYDAVSLFACTVYWYLNKNGLDPYVREESVYDRLDYVINTVPPPKILNTCVVKNESVKIIAEMPDDEIFYTLNGTSPTENSFRYTEPVTIETTCTLKARAFRKDKYPSQVSEALISVLDSYIEPIQTNAQMAPGLIYKYYLGEWRKLPDFNKLIPRRSGVTYVIGLNTNFASDCFGLTFDGYFDIKKSDIYTFYLLSDDGTKMYINDKLIIDNDYDHSLRERKARVALREGKYKVRIEYFEWVLDQGLMLFYSTNKITKQPIPPNIMFHEKTAEEN